MNMNESRDKALRVPLPRLAAILLLGSFFAAAFLLPPAFGAELAIPSLQAKAGQDIRVPLVVDKVDHLAGIKLVIHYNKDLLTFKGGVRSKSTDSMMHVINDKTPGKLIIVMAAARGIEGSDITLLTLFFSVKKELTANQEALIETTEAQFMGDDLKDIPCRTKAGKIAITPLPALKEEKK